MEYKLQDTVQKEGEAPVELPLAEQVIEKRGHVITYTPVEITANLKQMQKNVTETTAKLQFEEAKIANIEQHHPEILKMTDQELLTAYLYYETKSMVKACKQVIEDNKTDEAELLAEIEEMKKQIPALAAHDFAPTPAPVRAPAKQANETEPIKAQ